MKKNREKNFTGILILTIVVVMILAVSFPLQNKEEKTGDKINTTETEKVTLETDGVAEKIDAVEEINISIGSNVFVTGVDPYIGAYVEDGTDEFVENVMMLTLENKGEENIQLATVVLNDKYTFELTTLLPGKKVWVLEKNRAEYEPEFAVESVEVKNVALFDESPSMEHAAFEITGEDNLITITNISGEKIAGGKVFYKNVLRDCYLGGITYSGSIPALDAGESIKLSAKHYYKDTSEFIFVTYAK